VPLADDGAARPVWVRYYETVLEARGVAGDPAELAEAITAAGECSLGVEPYPWTVPVLAELLERQIPVVALSDAWPSLRRFFRQVELDTYVRAMVISAEEGFTRPDPRAFLKAEVLLGQTRSKIVFVDDWQRT
jgi:HAD superfamily hydrolase (TIGR01509 family)